MRISDWSSDVCSSDLAAEVAGAPDKADTAFRTIGELSRETGLPQHILRYWETRFPQLRRLLRPGNRPFHRPGIVRLFAGIPALLTPESYHANGGRKWHRPRETAPPEARAAGEGKKALARCMME